MASKTICIELGERLTKVCETSGNGSHIQHCFVVQTPDGAVSDGSINDVEKLSELLTASFEQNGMSRVKSVVFSLQSGKIAAREVKLPPVRDNKLQTMVEANASEYFPIDTSKYHVSYMLLERIEKGDDAGCRLMVLAAPKNLLEGYFKLAEALKLKLHAIDYSGSSRTHLLQKQTSDGVIMYVDVGCTASEVTIMDGRHQRLQRSFPAGGDEPVFARLTQSGRPDDNYLKALKELSLPPANIGSDSEKGDGSAADEQSLSDVDTREAPADDAEPAQAGAPEGMGRFISNVVRIADYYNSNNWENPIDRIVLYGECCAIYGLKESVEEAVSSPVEVMTAPIGFTAPESSDIPLSGFSACIGCMIAPVDFLPREFVASKKKKATPDEVYTRLGVLLFGGFVVIGFALTAGAVLNYMGAVSDKQRMEDEIASLAYAESRFTAYTDYTAAATGFETVYSKTDTPNARLVDFIGELERKMPSDIIVMSAVFTNEIVSMNITVESKESAAAVIVRLRTFQSIADVALTGISESSAESGVPQVVFSLVVTYGENPWMASADEDTLEHMMEDAMEEVDGAGVITNADEQVPQTQEGEVTEQ